VAPGHKSAAVLHVENNACDVNKEYVSK